MSAFFWYGNMSNNSYVPHDNGTCLNLTSSPVLPLIGTSPVVSYVIIVACAIISILWAVWHALSVLQIPIATFGMETGKKN